MVQALSACRLAGRRPSGRAFGGLTFDNGRRPRSEPIDSPLDMILDPFHKFSGFIREGPGPDTRVYVVDMVQYHAARIIRCDRATYETRIETPNPPNFA